MCVYELGYVMFPHFLVCLSEKSCILGLIYNWFQISFAGNGPSNAECRGRKSVRTEPIHGPFPSWQLVIRCVFPYTNSEEEIGCSSITPHHSRITGLRQKRTRMKRKIQRFHQRFLEQDMCSGMWLCGGKWKRWLKAQKLERSNVTVSAEQEWEDEKEAVAK